MIKTTINLNNNSNIGVIVINVWTATLIIILLINKIIVIIQLMDVNVDKKNVYNYEVIEGGIYNIF